MLVVLMVLLMGTVGATIALDASRNGLRSAAHHRIGTQNRYAAEAVLLSAISRIDILGGPGYQREIVTPWSTRPPPVMERLGEPPILVDHDTARMYALEICDDPDTDEFPPVQVAGPGAIVPSGVCAPEGTDESGTIGPGNAWEPTRYLADIYDCEQISTMIPGQAQGASAKSLRCIITARARAGLASAPTNTWRMGGATDYVQSTHQAAHDAQAVIVTPQLFGTGSSN